MPRWVPARSDVIAEYAREVLEVFPRGRLLVGIDGPDGAGKTTFADDLAAAFRASGTASAAVSLDAFHRAAADRDRPPADARVWYEYAYDYDAFRRRVVDPYRRAESVALEHRSRVDDAVLSDPRTFSPGPRAVLVVEGVFLHRPEIVGLWHTSAWLEVSPEVSLARYARRDGTDPDPSAPINRRYLGAQERYRREVDPRRRATATFDLIDPAHPRRVFSDAC